MKQSKSASLFESLVNTATGFLISLGMQVLMFPLFDVHISGGQHIFMTLAFTIASVLRGYILRRLFERFRKDGEEILGT